MPKLGVLDTTYPNRLNEIGVILLEPFSGTKKKHLLQCSKCNHIWTTTPLAITQIHKKWNTNSCPNCNIDRNNIRRATSRQQNIQSLVDKGFIILSNWDGRNSLGSNCKPLMVEVQNTKCGHIFQSNAVNLMRRDVECPICANKLRIQTLNQSSKDRSEEWRKTATEWRKYKSRVNNLTKIAYRQHRQIINPNNLPQGLAGTDGAYHLDHIVPIRYCFDNNIPEELCAHYENLQMLGWNDNVGSRDKLKDYVPKIFVDFVRTVVI